MQRILSVLQGDQSADRVVPPSGAAAWLTGFTSGAMAFLAVFALALSLATGRLADRWSKALDRTATVRISAPDAQMAQQSDAVLKILSTTPGVASARAMDEADQRRLLAPWFGPDLPLDALALPRLIEVTETETGYDAEGLRQRLAAEAPGAVLDDHSRWRRPMVAAAQRLRLMGFLSIGLIGAAMAAMITLAVGSALSANQQVIKVMRLVGAQDSYIARAFVRRFTLRATLGALVGTVLGMLGVALLPAADADGGFLTGLGFQGLAWFFPLILPVLAAAVAFAATRFAAQRKLKELT